MARRTIGFWMTLCLVVGNMIGSGVYLLPATLAPFGWNALIGWGVTIVGALCLALIFARLGTKLPQAGGPYAFTRAAFGPTAGFLVAWSYWVMIWVGNGALAVAVVSGLSLVFPGLASHAAWAAVAVVWVLTAVNIGGVAAAGRVQVVTTVLKLVPLAAVLVLAVWIFGNEGVSAVVPAPQTPIGAGAIAGAAALTFWGFLGVESATVPADKVIDPARTIPRATLWGTVLTGATYILICTSVALLMPADQLAGSPAPIAELLGRHWGSWVGGAVAIFAAVSAFGTLNGFILLQGEVPWVMAQGGVFPRWLAKESARGTPVRAHLVSSALLSVVTLANYSRSMGELFTLGISVSIAAGLLAYLACALAVFRLLPGDKVVRGAAIVAAAYTLWMVYGLGVKAMGWGLVLLAAGVPVLWWSGRADRSARH